VEAYERVSDVLGAPYPEYKPCCRILYRLKVNHGEFWGDWRWGGKKCSVLECQHIVAVVKSAEN